MLFGWLQEKKRKKRLIQSHTLHHRKNKNKNDKALLPHSAMMVSDEAGKWAQSADSTSSDTCEVKNFELLWETSSRLRCHSKQQEPHQVTVSYCQPAVDKYICDPNTINHKYMITSISQTTEGNPFALTRFLKFDNLTARLSNIP